MILKMLFIIWMVCYPLWIQKILETLKSCLDNIRKSLNDFKVLSSDVKKGSFKLLKIESALHSLHRPRFKRKKVLFNIEYSNISRQFEVKQTFYPILQIFNNLIIDSSDFLTEDKKKEIKIYISLDDRKQNISCHICDTGIANPF